MCYPVKVSHTLNPAIALSLWWLFSYITVPCEPVTSLPEETAWISLQWAGAHWVDRYKVILNQSQSQGLLGCSSLGNYKQNQIFHSRVFLQTHIRGSLNSWVKKGRNHPSDFWESSTILHSDRYTLSLLINCVHGGFSPSRQFPVLFHHMTSDGKILLFRC